MIAMYVCTVIHYHHHHLPLYINFLFLFMKLDIRWPSSSCVKCFLFLTPQDVLPARMWAIIYEFFPLLQTWTNPIPHFHCMACPSFSFILAVPLQESIFFPHSVIVARFRSQSRNFSLVVPSIEQLASKIFSPSSHMAIPLPCLILSSESPRL